MNNPKSIFEDDNEEINDNGQCEKCGLTDDHSIDCPNDDSKYGDWMLQWY